MLTGHLQIYLETIFQSPYTQKQKQCREGDYESTQNLQHSIRFEQHRSCQFRTHWKLQTWAQLPNCSGQPAGCCCPQNAHTTSLTHPSSKKPTLQPASASPWLRKVGPRCLAPQASRHRPHTPEWTNSGFNYLYGSNKT